MQNSIAQNALPPARAMQHIYNTPPSGRLTISIAPDPIFITMTIQSVQSYSRHRSKPRNHAERPFPSPCEGEDRKRGNIHTLDTRARLLMLMLHRRLAWNASSSHFPTLPFLTPPSSTRRYRPSFQPTIGVHPRAHQANQSPPVRRLLRSSSSSKTSLNRVG